MQYLLPDVGGLYAEGGAVEAEALGAALPAGLGETKIPAGAGGALLTNCSLLAGTGSCRVTLTNAVPEKEHIFS